MSNVELRDGSILETGTPEFTDILTSKEVADYLGMTERSLSSARIPHAKIGERRFYFRQTVAAWLKAREGR